MGDCLISLSLLKGLDSHVEIIGTENTKRIAELMGDSFNIKVVFRDVPSFYNIRKDGVLSAIRDILIFRRYVISHNIENLIFEKKDFRLPFLTWGLKVKVNYVQKKDNVYNDRKNLIEKIFSIKLVLPTLPILLSPNHVLISTASRINKKNITYSQLDDLIFSLRKQNSKIFIRLIDYSHNFESFKGVVDAYHTDTSLIEVREMIIESDIFIGPDSLLVHLSYYLKKPFFIIYNIESPYFMPPRVLDSNNYLISHKCKFFKKCIYDKFSKIGLSK